MTSVLRRLSEASATSLMRSGRLSRPACLPVFGSSLNPNLVASTTCSRKGAEQADSVTAHDYLGLALMKTGRTQEAVEQFELVTRLDPDYAPVRYSLGMTLRKLGRNERAAIELEKFRQLQEKEDKRKR